MLTDRPNDQRHDPLRRLPLPLPPLPISLCCRALLGSVLKQAAQLGYRPMAGLEFEWFNFAETAESLQSKKFVDPQPITPGTRMWL